MDGVEAITDKELIEIAKEFSKSGTGKGDALLFRVCKRLESALARIAKLERRARKNMDLVRDLKFQLIEKRDIKAEKARAAEIREDKAPGGKVSEKQEQIDNVDYLKLWNHLHKMMEMLVGDAPECIENPKEVADWIRGAMEWCERNGPNLYSKEEE